MKKSISSGIIDTILWEKYSDRKEFPKIKSHLSKIRALSEFKLDLRGKFQLNQDLKKIKEHKKREEVSLKRCDFLLLIRTKIDEGIELFVPKSSNNLKRRKPKWMNPTVCKSIKKKHLLFKKYIQSDNSFIYRQYLEARNMAARAVKNAKRDHQRKVARDCKSNPKTFWKYVNNSRKYKPNISPLTNDKINFVTDDKGKADMLNNFFSSVFTLENTENVPYLTPGEKSSGFLLSDLRVTQEAVQKKLRELNPYKSPGPDKIAPKLLSELSDALSRPISILFNLSLEHGEVPAEWKHAQVTPIFKKGDKTSPNNYRPVSLTCILCKVLESFIRDSIQDHMESLNLYSDCQHGFRTARSCTSQLLEVKNDFTSFYDDNMPFDVIYLDFKKAFDAVPHIRLLNKMRGYGIDGNVLKWTESFLKGRTQQVKINNELSDISNVTSGIPQGSVLGPILFTIFINDLPEYVHSLCKIFADDTKIYNLCQNFNTIQEDLHSLQAWSEKWQLFFNNDKCVCLHFGKKNPQADYTLKSNNDVSIIKKSSEERDLGVTFDTNLKFDSHINNVINKANQALGIIKRNFKYMDEEALLTLYKSIVRPILEYGQPVWAPFLLRQSRALESIQRRATKLIPSIKHLPYEERLQHLKLPSLKYRRTRGDLILTYNLFHSHSDREYLSRFFELAKSHSTRGHCFKLFKKPCKVNLKKHSFSHRIVNYWNNLPFNTVTAPDTNTFKKLLDGDLLNLLYIYD